jgi:cytochrome c oxidase subunit 2
VLRSRHTWPLIGLGLVVGAVMALVAFGIDWLPQATTRQADRHDTLLWFVVVSSAAIFTIVCVFLFYSVWRFRVDDSDDSDGPPLHGNTPLEIIWTAIPSALLAVVVVYSFLVLSSNEALAKNRMTVQVLSQQFAWHFTYPEAGVTTGDLYMPVDRQTVLKMTAKDVLHSLYVPEFRLKQDNVPGIMTKMIINPTKTGTFPIICTELCGIGHSLMRSRAIVLSQQDFDAWLEKAKQTASSSSSPGAAAQPPASSPAP